ncbi:Arylsulfatase [Rubripirellula reticaptiva]|uniref:Arylsulfatase n=2 Tax=Rubripirellula reticaptiva TaxID=2528013 RepID=A0A5C6ENK7_9BACT|nr:Arylsulfatase [Rubripirellula reticaptiva]
MLAMSTVWMAGLHSVAEAQNPPAPTRPNVIWIMSEDNSAEYLKHFDADGAPAPHIEALAKHGITFDRAFSNAPVCSVARTTLITSCYGPRIGTQYHRRSRLAAMPEGVRMFPAYLRDAGYYTTNHSKEDYNATDRDTATVWNDSSNRASWKNRPSKSTPFFHVETTAVSHESRLHFPESDVDNNSTTTDPDSIKLQPYFPDTPLLRYTRARYHDRMMDIDEHVGKVVADLTQAGELENTFIFYFGDHGGVLPRSKGYVYESGLRVPLVVRVPEKFKTATSRSLGDRTTGFVEFVDFGPTVLALAGIQTPANVDGKPFMGLDVDAKEVDGRDETFGYADRFDEKYDLVRTLRKGDWKYIRNFESFLPDAMQNNYRYEMAAYRQWRALHHEGKLNEVQNQFFLPKSSEALYDLSVDPHEIQNLAGDPTHAEKLSELRARLIERLKSMPDLSFMPEAVLVDEAMKNPAAFGQAHRAEIANLIDVANLSLLPWDQAKPKLTAALNSDDPWTCYWGLIAASSFGKAAASLLPDATKQLQHTEPLVAARAVEFVAIAGDQDPRPFLYRSLQRATSEIEVLPILGTAVYLNDHTDGRFPIDPNLIQLSFKAKPKGEVQRRLDYLK